MVDADLVSSIRDYFDLNSYEAKVWLALLGRGIASAGELAEITSVPRSRTYDILESLERKGLAMMRLGKPIKYIATNPDEVIGKMKKQIELNLAERSRRLDEMKNTDVWEEIVELYTKGIKKVDPTQVSGAIRGRHHLHDQFEELFGGAEKEILIVTGGIELNRIMEYHHPILKTAKEKGVDIRISIKKDGVTDKNLKLAKSVSEVRELIDIDSRFVLIDNKELIFMLLPEQDIHPSYDTGIWIHSPFFAGALKVMFTREWEKMKKL
ncbi:MAG: TrmB family transcriptional regulator [Candidatus Altiarchaeota archaeon]|nr:TrmB family transcriptional regulator [Candidatus Altiarchaeota archaeon]